MIDTFQNKKFLKKMSHDVSQYILKKKVCSLLSTFFYIYIS
jgi:hypothetical protein